MVHLRENRLMIAPLRRLPAAHALRPRTVLLPLLATVGLVAPATSCATIGSTKAGSAIETITPGRAQAFRSRSTATVRLRRLSIFVDGSSQPTPATRLELGVYKERAGAARRRIGRCVVTTVVPNAWNACTFKAAKVRRGGRYWTVVLQRAGTAGTVRFRTRIGKGRSFASSQRSLRALPRRWRNGARRRAQNASIFASSAAGPTAPGPAKPPGRKPVYCDIDVSSRPALVSAVQTLGNGGKTVCAHAGDYGDAELELSVRHAAKLTLAAAPGERVTLPSVLLVGVSNLRVQGFDMPRGGFDTAQKSAQGIELVGNEIHDCACQALRIWAGDQNVLFEGNYVHDIRYDGSWNSGWGMNATGATSGLKVRYNTFDGLGNDAMQIGDSVDGEIVGNVIAHVTPTAGYPDSHADAIMLWAGSKRWVIKNNRISDGRGVLMSGSTSDVRMENNLIVRIQNLCHDGGTTGSSSAGLVRYTWIRNTMYDCGSLWNGAGYGLLTDGPASGNTLERNLVIDVDFDSGSQFSRSDHNLIKAGARPGSTDRTFTPRFADLADYRPTNLPGGYEDVGYRSAPAGYQAAP